MKSIVFIILVSFVFTSCSSYVNKMHREFDRADGKRLKPRNHGDQFDFYRKNPIKNPKGLVNTSDKKVMMPTVKRDYQTPKRIKADDLNDNGTAGSLWVGGGDDNFLFTNNRKKSNGDIVLINVEARLKTAITNELKRAFPDIKKKSKKKDGEKDDQDDSSTASKDTNNQDNEAAANEPKQKDEVFDRISSIVIEEISKDHLLLRGRKFLLYKNRKRLVEVQALVPRRDITDSDTVGSSSIIESTVNVIR